MADTFGVNGMFAAMLNVALGLADPVELFGTASATWLGR